MDISAGDQLAIVARLLLAGFLGAVVGLERDLRDYPAGLRTMALVTLGSALFMEVSRLVGAEDRIAAQVVTGIGFLGAGVIFREGLDVKGVTTAATIWAMAAVGLAVGVELYVVAPLATLIILIALELRAFTKSERFEGGIRAWLEKVAPPIKEDIQEQREEQEEHRRRDPDTPTDDDTNYKPPWNQEKQ
ncbi:MAG TPA: MgtC/SapB family protein [Dehalococcoidia bacterium]|nr:MgtC/SapB family protein [Dehalococcoidia bacterium]